MKLRLILLVLSGAVALTSTAAPAQTAPVPGFSRIVHGWTNYSTAFNATHDPGVDSEYATVACFYSPPVDVRPVEFSAAVVWFGSGGQGLDFGNFTFQVHFWSGLDAFIQNPRRGNLAALPFPAPTDRSTTVPDAITRGGRPAYLLRFALTNAALTLTQCQTVLVGFSAHADAAQSGELYVPTAAFDGSSDLQGGNIVSFGWTHLAGVGGLTLYYGLLATELTAQPLAAPPRLAIQQTTEGTCLTWPAAAGCFVLESGESLSSPINWSLVEETPLIENGLNQLCLPVASDHRWFRLKQAPQSVFAP